MMNVVDYPSIVLISTIGLLFWYSVAAIGLELWNRWFARPRQDSDPASLVIPSRALCCTGPLVFSTRWLTALRMI